MHKESDLLTVSEVAREKGVSRTAVFYAIKDGRLPAVRVGRHWVIRRVDFEGYDPKYYTLRPKTTRRIPIK